MAPVPSSVQQLVNENTADDFLRASDILLKFAANVLKSPNEPKYRKIRLANPVVESKLLPMAGAMECLFEMGFIEAEDGESLSLPQNASLSIISQIKTQLDNERAVINKTRVAATTAAAQSSSSSSSSSSGQSQRPVQGATASQPVQQPLARPAPQMDILVKEQAFYRKLESQLQHVLVYEDLRLQQKAQEVIPVIQLTEEATQMMQRLKQAKNSTDNTVSQVPDLDERDCLILALLKWFKHSFFRWMDAPKCRSCGGNTSGVGSVPPTEEDLRWGGNRVENYRCNSCHTYTRFVRYNNPGQLLETREGRCGEWANCFTLCCRALDFEARYVLDWTDHVWTEVYSNSQQRWVHCDPCENVCDKPLLYEAGWGKKLSYIIAFSKDDIEDVTWRYTAKFSEVLSRRTECRESWLVTTVYNLDKNKRSKMSDAARNTRLKRKIVDLVEFMMEKSAEGQNLSGRTTGSEAWRIARGEMGDQSRQGTAAEPFVFKLTDQEKTSKCLHVTYSCARDEYTRVTMEGETTQGYQSMVHKAENVFRKEEHDWKMVYLARTEGSKSAEIVWKFDFTDSGQQIDRLEVKFDCATYENGRINLMICSDTACAMLRGGPSVETVTELQGEMTFTLTAAMSGGKGEVAWQHTQLFRQSSEDRTYNPLEIKVFFK